MILDASVVLAIVPREIDRAEPLLFKGTEFAQTDVEPALKD